MKENRFKCSECGKIFGSEDTFEEHSMLEHQGEAETESAESWRLMFDSLKSAGKKLRSSFMGGFLIGLIIASAAFSGYIYYDSIDKRTDVPVTVVTCESCEYEKFRDATDRMFKASYTEVDYRSEEGQRLIEKYDLKYVPGFIFDRKKLEKAENFTAVEPTLVKNEDAYVIPDEGVEVAQRLSTGIPLNNSGPQ